MTGLSESLVGLLVNLVATIASILAAVIAFFFSAQTNLRGKGVAAVEDLYRKLLVTLIWIFAVSVVSFLYFYAQLPWAALCPLDVVFVILTALLLPATMVAFWVLLARE